MPKSHWVYILYCCNDSYYTGYTTDLTRRYEEHKKGTEKSKYTRSFKPIKIAQAWQFDDKSTALKIEKAIKKMRKKDKELLIANPKKLIHYTR